MAKSRPPSKRKAGAKARHSAAPDSRKVAGPKARDSNGRFRKGQSGNPGGRKRGDAAVTELARKHAPEMLKVLVSIAVDESAAVNSRVAAASQVLDRAYGRPRQALEHSGPEGADLPSAIMVTLVKPESDE